MESFSACSGFFFVYFKQNMYWLIYPYFFFFNLCKTKEKSNVLPFGSNGNCVEPDRKD